MVYRGPTYCVANWHRIPYQPYRVSRMGTVVSRDPRQYHLPRSWYFPKESSSLIWWLSEATVDKLLELQYISYAHLLRFMLIGAVIHTMTLT